MILLILVDLKGYKNTSLKELKVLILQNEEFDYKFEKIFNKKII